MKKEWLPSKNESDFFALSVDKSELKLVSLPKQKIPGKVLSYGSIDIPGGLVGKEDIRSERKLSELIKKLINKTQPKPTRRKFCLIGLPEDQIFIKIIEVSKKLSESEISRVIEQKTSGLFPVSYENIILDWQPIGEEKTKKRILIIAAPAKLIKSLVAAAEKADLTPIAIEPKSFALGRLLTYIQKKQSLILIDMEKKGASLSIYLNGEIKFHTKIGGPINPEEIGLVINRTLHYYGDEYPQAKPIKRVIFSGDIRDQYFLEKVGQQFENIQIEKITLPEFKQEDFEEKKTFFASAIAFCLKKINVFAKHGSINLLPTRVKNNFRVGIAQRTIGYISRGAIWFLLFLLGITSIFYLKLYLDNSQLEKVIESKKNYQISESLKNKEEIIKRINRKSQTLVNLSSQEYNLGSFVENIITKMPAQLKLISVDVKENTVVITGIGRREQIIDYQSRLKNIENVRQVNLPLSSLERAQRSEFEIELTFQKDG